VESLPAACRSVVVVANYEPADGEEVNDGDVRVRINDDNHELTKEKVLGKGVSGTVYDASEYAVKIVFKAKKAFFGPDRDLRVRAEGTLLGDVHHRNIIQLLGKMENDSSHVLVMQLVRDGQLLKLSADGKGWCPLLEDIAGACIADIARALEYLHNKDIVHRDIKPGNILMDRNRIAYLCDFGDAQLSTTPLEESRGTFAFWPPEAFDGWDPEPTSEQLVHGDLWALGVTLYMMLFGNHPFLNFADVDSLLACEDASVRGLLCLPKGASVEAAVVLKGLLAKKPADRMTLDNFRKSDFVAKYKSTDCAVVRAACNALGTIPHTAAAAAVPLHNLNSQPLAAMCAWLKTRPLDAASVTALESLNPGAKAANATTGAAALAPVDERAAADDPKGDATALATALDGMQVVGSTTMRQLIGTATKQDAATLARALHAWILRASIDAVRVLGNADVRLVGHHSALEVTCAEFAPGRLRFEKAPHEERTLADQLGPLVSVDERDEPTTRGKPQVADAWRQARLTWRCTPSLAGYAQLRAETPGDVGGQLLATLQRQGQLADLRCLATHLRDGGIVDFAALRLPLVEPWLRGPRIAAVIRDIVRQEHPAALDALDMGPIVDAFLAALRLVRLPGVSTLGFMLPHCPGGALVLINACALRGELNDMEVNVRASVTALHEFAHFARSMAMPCTKDTIMLCHSGFEVCAEAGEFLEFSLNGDALVTRADNFAAIAGWDGVDPWPQLPPIAGTPKRVKFPPLAGHATHPVLPFCTSAAATSVAGEPSAVAPSAAAGAGLPAYG
jgi:tRNA A-37 threonylcarbamoyl transferase component Bud32